MTLEERINDFKYCVACDLHEEDRQMVLDFSAYWTEHSPRSKKFRAELEKVFDIKKRFATWKRNSEKWDKKPIQKATFVDKVMTKEESLNNLFKTLENEYGDSKTI